MSMHPQDIHPIPEETARIARAALPRGNTYMIMRDQLGTLYEDQVFAALFPKRGRPAEAPWQLALVCVFQFSEGLSDRQAASAVRTRIDWKYALGLELTDPGFDFSVLSRVPVPLDCWLGRNASAGKDARAFQARLDSSSLVGSNEQTPLMCSPPFVHSTDSKAWEKRMPGDAQCRRPRRSRMAARAWFDRYGHRIEESRLPKGQAERQQYAELIGTDGSQLLSMLYEPSAPAHLKELPAVQILRQSWVFQYYTDEGQLRWRKAEDVPPAGMRYDSPYETASTLWQ